MKKETYNEDTPMKRSTPALKKTAAHLIKWREDLGLTPEDIAKRSNLDMDCIERVEKGKGRAPEFLAYTGVLMKETPKEKALKKWEEMGHALFDEMSIKHKPEQ